MKNNANDIDLSSEINDIINKLPSSKGLSGYMKDIYDPLYHIKFIYYLHVCKSPNCLNKFIINKISDVINSIYLFYSFSQNFEKIISVSFQYLKHLL